MVRLVAVGEWGGCKRMFQSIPGGWTIYSESPPDIELREGLVHVSYRVGRNTLEIVLRPCTYREALKRAHKVADEIAEQHQVVSLRPKRSRGG